MEDLRMLFAERLALVWRFQKKSGSSSP
ncbi:unnamed protein product [Ectocarpus sp. CCAP 1310/34]|nr:unnamed protein product [Ectocarpus sp. CCAP 1310/34]